MPCRVLLEKAHGMRFHPYHGGKPGHPCAQRHACRGWNQHQHPGHHHHHGHHHPMMHPHHERHHHQHRHHGGPHARHHHFGRRHSSEPEKCITRYSPTTDFFEVEVDVKGFTTDELNVKIVNNCVVVVGKHSDADVESCQFFNHLVRRVMLPNDVHPNHVKCTVNSNGTLRLFAPRIEKGNLLEKNSIPIIVLEGPSTENEQRESESGDHDYEKSADAENLDKVD